MDDFAFGPIRNMPCVNSFDIQNMDVLRILERKCYVGLDTYDDDYGHQYPNECGSPISSYIFFITYTLLITFIVLNLVVAVILEGFEDSN